MLYTLFDLRVCAVKNTDHMEQAHLSRGLCKTNISRVGQHSLVGYTSLGGQVEEMAVKGGNEDCEGKAVQTQPLRRGELETAYLYMEWDTGKKGVQQTLGKGGGAEYGLAYIHTWITSRFFRFLHFFQHFFSACEAELIGFSCLRSIYFFTLCAGGLLCGCYL